MTRSYHVPHFHVPHLAKHSLTPWSGLLALVAAVEYGGVLWWGAVWPWKNGSIYPGDGGMNDFLILAACLLVGASLAGAAASVRHVSVLALLAAMITALPLAILTLLLLLDNAFLDPVVYYLALLPSLAAALLPYALILHRAKGR
jgi:hypothetical protein